VIAPVVRRLVRAAYRITPESAQRSLDRVRGVFRHVEEQLSDGRRFLTGERFTAADLTCARKCGKQARMTAIEPTRLVSI
jgi:glutathione S-transferase